ncbi:amidohydrolase [Myxococcota bacterium]|nr:amidohydrolase [Myxococcota bacterium]
MSACAASWGWHSSSPMHPQVARVMEKVVADRRALHRIPEPAREERLTAAYLETALRDMGLAPRCGVGGFGILCDLESGGPGPHDPGTSPLIALRADIDGIRVEERTGLPFASTHPGLMHACGHDGHMAILLGAARLFAANPPMHLRLRLIFQPAEEQHGGARDMIRDGALAGVDRIFGAHLWSWLPTGTVASCDGAMMAQTERVTIDITGRGGHAALPRGTADAVVTASLLVTALQTAVSRGVNPPAEPAILTIGELHAGSAPNVIAASARLNGTLRALSGEVMETLRASIRRICAGIAATTGATIEVTFISGYPALVNHTDPFGQVCAAATAVADFAQAVPVMAGEDFSYYLQQIPGCFFFVGAGDPAIPVEHRGHHHEPVFDLDERALAVGVSMWHQLVRNLDYLRLSAMA